MRRLDGISWLGLALALLGPGGVAWLSEHLASEPETFALRAIGLAIFVALLVAVAAVARAGEELSPADVGFGASSWRTPVWGLLLGIFLITVHGRGLYALLAWLEIDAFSKGMASLEALPTWQLCGVVVIVAGGEEWLDRGYALERLAVWTGSIWVAAALSLSAFVLVQLPIWGLAASLTMLLSGALLTLFYLWQRDIAMLMLAHVVSDLYGLGIAPRVLAKLGEH